MRLLSQNEVLEKTAALEAAEDLGKILSHKWHDHIAGGLADKRSPADFPREDLLKGMIVEMEHTSDPSVACEIAMDHLVEDPHYYNHEQDMAKEVQDKLGYILPREDSAIKLAELMGIQLAGMTKEAIPNPFSAIRGIGSRLLGRTAPKVVGNVLGRETEQVAGRALAGNVLPSVSGEMGAKAIRPGAVPGTHLRAGANETTLAAQAKARPIKNNIQTDLPNAAPAAPVPGSVEHFKAVNRADPTEAAMRAGAVVPHSPGSVVPNPKGTGPDVKRFGWGKAALGAGALGAGYAAYKGIPWAANKLEETSAMPLAYGGGWSATPYGYGNTPYGPGTATMGYGV